MENFQPAQLKQFGKLSSNCKKGPYNEKHTKTVGVVSIYAYEMWNEHKIDAK